MELNLTRPGGRGERDRVDQPRTRITESGHSDEIRTTDTRKTEKNRPSSMSVRSFLFLSPYEQEMNWIPGINDITCVHSWYQWHQVQISVWIFNQWSYLECSYVKYLVLQRVDTSYRNVWSKVFKYNKSLIFELQLILGNFQRFSLFCNYVCVRFSVSHSESRSSIPDDGIFRCSFLLSKVVSATKKITN